MAAFHLIIYGRFWVITEGNRSHAELILSANLFEKFHLVPPGQPATLPLPRPRSVANTLPGGPKLTATAGPDQNAKITMVRCTASEQYSMEAWSTGYRLICVIQQQIAILASHSTDCSLMLRQKLDPRRYDPLGCSKRSGPIPTETGCSDYDRSVLDSPRITPTMFLG